MTQQPDNASGRTIRALSRGLAEASDAQVARAVAVVDQLPNRGEADRLIAPLRPRLARLRPPRPLRFARLLFLPLQPLIVPSPRWQPSQAGIPRGALTPLASTVHHGLSETVASVASIIHTATVHDSAAVYRAGCLLWPRAADLLSAAPPPVGWEETGWSVAIYPPLARRIGAVLSHAVALQELVAETDAGIAPPRREPVSAMLTDAAMRCPEALPMLVHLVLAKLPAMAPMLADLPRDQSPASEAAVRQAIAAALEALLSGMEDGGSGAAVVPAWDLTDAVQELRRRVTLLDQLSQRVDLPQGHARVKAVRQRLDAGCRQLFAEAVATEFLPALRDAAPAASLEATARRLRELESEARTLGGGEAYDAQLRAAVGAVRSDGMALSKPARARLVEILAGPEAALAMLRAA